MIINTYIIHTHRIFLPSKKLFTNKYKADIIIGSGCEEEKSFSPIRKRYIKHFWGYGNRIVKRKERINGRNKYPGNNWER